MALYILILRLTCKIKVTGGEHIKQMDTNNQGVVVALWHGRLLCMPLLFPKRRKVHALISDHHDGRIIRKTAWSWGIKTIVGSSSKGGARALKQLAGLLKKGEVAFITPDGPKGPRMKLASGAVDAAILAGVPVLPVAISATRGILINSWDKFLAPRPFSTINIIWGEAIKVSKASRGGDIQRCEQALNILQDTADKTSPFKVEPLEVGAA